ncbi:MAG: methyltransferase domain-containing protein [Deltaproteobacteria bacterium]|jgi:ubiquinone/menaquinone biosynthesis C-methylase UbiE|nr:methyltransferase domain-containing protein [Deltaproteobacteria bacterium]
MRDDPYRQMFFEANALSHRKISNPMGKDWPTNWLLENMELKFGSRVLYPGCGTGKLIPHIKLRLGLSGQLLAMDASAEALARVPRDDAQWATLIKAPPDKIPVIDSSIDDIIYPFSFERPVDLLKMALEFHRILKPGGRAFIIWQPSLTSSSTPCPFGLNEVFLQAGFNRIDFDDDLNLFFFAASKVSPYFFSVGASA